MAIPEPHLPMRNRMSAAAFRLAAAASSAPFRLPPEWDRGEARISADHVIRVKSTVGKVSARAPTGTEAPAEIPQCWSAQRKTELVLRLLRGEPVDAVARESQVPAHELEEWRPVFLDSDTKGLKRRVDPDERELTRVQAKLAEVMMRLARR